MVLGANHVREGRQQKIGDYHQGKPTNGCPSHKVIHEESSGVDRCAS